MNEKREGEEFRRRLTFFLQGGKKKKE